MNPNNKIVRNCDKCGNEDSISSISGLCSTCSESEFFTEDCKECDKLLEKVNVSYEELVGQE